MKKIRQIYNTINNYSQMVKIGHTLFAMPFAFIGFFLAIKQGYEINLFLLFLVVLCMFFARNSAMSFNRYIDRYIDKENIRTQNRHIPAGLISEKKAIFFIFANCFLFIVTTYFINKLTFFLSPIALIVILGYSYTKRITFLSHYILGLGLSLAPIGAYISLTNKFDLLPIFFSIIVLLWVAGFDIIYSLQDEEYDKGKELLSIPSKFGRKKALIISALTHFIVSVLIIFIGLYINFSFYYWIGSVIFIILLTYQHLIIKPNDISKVNLAFFTLNGLASILYAIFIILDIYFI